MILSVSTLTHCPLCRGSDLARMPVPGNWVGDGFFSELHGQLGLCRCRGCSLIFTNPRPGPDVLRDFYEHCYSYECHRAEPDGLTQNTARFLLSHCGPPSGGLLDMGCGAGFLVRAATELGWDAIGYDVSQKAVRACLKQGLRATTSFADVGMVSVVVSNYALEHVGNWDEFFGSIRTVLRPGGKAVLVTP